MVHILGAVIEYEHILLAITDIKIAIFILPTDASIPSLTTFRPSRRIRENTVVARLPANQCAPRRNFYEENPLSLYLEGNSPHFFHRPDDLYNYPADG